MTQIKRQLSLNQSIDMEMKRLRTRLSDESTSHTCFENLSNELLYEIFEYLDACDIYESFSNLNNRLQNLIISSSILLRIKVNSEALLEDRCQHVIIPNSHRILSLHFRGHPWGELLIDKFFNHCIIDSSFHHSLLHYTPQLRHLFCHGVIESVENFKNDLSTSLPHLKFVNFEKVSAPFDEFEVFITKISSQLQILKIYTLQNRTYLDGNRWEQLIKEYMPQLEKFYFNFTQDIDDDREINLSDLSEGFINRFSSPFWSERKWVREIEVYCGSMVFSIHPYKKQRIDLHEHMNTNTYSKQNSTEDNYISNREKSDHGIIQLTILDYEDIGLNGQSIKKLKSALEAIQFTHLNIDDDTMSINMLLGILHLLPNIESLKLSSIPIVKLESLFIEHTKNHLSVLAINKITKVKLGQVTEEQEIEFFINLCPHIEYLEVGCMSYTDVPSLMKFILMNRMTRIPNLCHLCFNFRMADENLVRTLANIMDSETVNDNYTIQRSGNKISVHWKL
ncbi:unnamed protein product [Adineta steineri]|uniref:F-box domain-containing protein n=1 Tax=Adineta steineri TaxID=433720 RepID=A0A813U860_9BILA|nr:unnamed protein product [Adineta steineri]